MQDASAMPVDGHTQFVPLLAYPSAHVRTPGFFNARCAQIGRNAVMAPWQVAPERLATALQAVRAVDSIRGAVVTIPHKGSVAALCDELEGVSAATGVCNVIRKTPDGRLVGAMLDGLGFVQGLLGQGFVLRGEAALLAGAGGAATALAFALADAGVRRLALLNRSQDKVEALAALLARDHPELAVETRPTQWQDFAFAINGTSLGMHEGDALPFDVQRLGPQCCVAEVVMNPDDTALLVNAARRGLRTHRGVHMIEAQIALLVEATTSALP